MKPRTYSPQTTVRSKNFGRIFYGLWTMVYGLFLVSSPAFAAPATLIAPTLSATVNSSSQISLNWTDPNTNPNESGYVLERRTTSTSFVVIAQPASGVLSFVNSGLTPSTTYYYRIKAVGQWHNKTISSPYSAEILRTTLASVPNAPTALTATSAGTSQINLSWTDNSTNETGFKIERGATVSGPFSQIATTAAGVKTYQNTGLTPATSYFYRVRAYNSVGNSAYTNIANATTAACSYTISPTSRSVVSDAATGSVTVTAGTGCSWTAVSNAPFMTITNGATGSGNGSVAYSVALNDLTTSRTGTLTIATKTFTLTQAAPDIAGPTLTITSPADGSTSINPNLTISGTSFDPSGIASVAVTVNGTAAAVTGTTSWSSSLTLNAASNSISVVAKDTKNNSTTKSINVTYTPCSYSISPTSGSMISGGGVGSVAVTAQTGCTWTAVSNNTAWLALTAGASGNGNGTVSYSGLENTALSSRTGTLTIAAKTFTLTQAAAVDTTAPSVPTGLNTLSVSATQIDLTWLASTDTGGSGLAGYKIFRAGVQVATSTTAGFSNTGLSASTQYCYTISAYDNAGNTSAQGTQSCATTQTIPDTTPPTIPLNVSGAVISCSQINLSWSASSDTGGSGLRGYRIYKNSAFLKEVTTTSNSETGLIASTMYTYAVAAIDNASNESAQSTSTVVNTPACADTQAPVVSITSPTSGAYLKGTINVNATATDNVGVVKVELWVDGALRGSDTVSPYSLSLDTTTLTNATHSLVAKAYDAVPNVGSSTSVSVNVDNAPPTVTLDQPTNGSTVSGTITMSATAND